MISSKAQTILRSAASLPWLAAIAISILCSLPSNAHEPAYVEAIESAFTTHGRHWESSDATSDAPISHNVIDTEFLSLDWIFRGQNAFRPPTRRSSPHRKPSRSLFSGFDFFSTPQLTSGLATVVQSLEAQLRQASDAGLMFASPAAIGTMVIRRSPIIHDDKTRGSKTGQSLRSGSYWVPARMDLDTALSKIDSRILDDALVIRGPYSSTYGPGFRFVDFDIADAPRYDSLQTHGSTALEYQSNGEQWYGRQTILVGDADSGLRISYGHRTGNDYESGNGTEIPASYKSRDWDVAYGIDLSPGTSLEFHYLRLDQTDVELAGQAFDIDYLVTDAFEVELTSDIGFADWFELSAWYNRTELAGSAQRDGKRRQFPVYDDLNFEGNTDVDSMSTGYKAAWTWQDENESTLTAGTDLRYVRQGLNEITSADLGLNFWEDRNSPIPRSHASNPGLFFEMTHPIDHQFTFTGGARLDWMSANIDDAATKLADVVARGPADDPLSLADVLGSDEFDQDFTLGSAFVMTEYQPGPYWTATLAYGYAERAPNLTELYAAQSFMFLLQNGLNTVTGHPELDKERLWQLDASLQYDDGRLRGRLSGFHSWIKDYVTFENMRTSADQASLKFVNTDLATLAGGEFYMEYDASPLISSFASLSFVEGRDHSRNGNAATQRAEPGIPSTPTAQVAGASRSDLSGVAASDEEPLPNIAPLTQRIGVRLHEPIPTPRWSVELSARLVSRQDRVATSLLESETPGFTIWDLRGFMQATNGLRLIAGVENFTDKQYREYLDFRSQSFNTLQMFQPGRSFYFGGELTY